MPHDPQPMPFAAQRRHQYWSADLRYLEDHALGTDKPVYVIALANTKGPGPRHLIIGFTDEGDYYEPENPQERADRDRLLDALSEERLQSIVSTYTDPVLRIRYTKADHHRGPVGMLQIHRDTTELPYAVRKTIGSTDKTDKSARQVRQSQVFLRDGTFTREARPEEIERLRADAERSRQRQQHNEIS